MDGSGYFLHIKEGVTKGSFLSMISYGIGILPLIHDLRTVHPHVTQLWYADDSFKGGKFEALQDHMKELMARGPLRGYFPEPTRSILVVSLRNLQSTDEYFRGTRVIVVYVASLVTQ